MLGDAGTRGGSKFTTRVELHDADESDYEILHKEMMIEGFESTVTSDAGTTYHLGAAASALGRTTVVFAS
jgi:hypothetical protein